MFYEYVDAGSWTETTYKANENDLQNLRIRQRIAVDVATRDLKGTMLGEQVRMPLALAPTGLAGMQIADGEVLAAKAAEEFGIPFCLSMMSICSVEHVAAHTNRPFWMQLYLIRDRAFIEQLIERARSAGCSALMLTLDLPVSGLRHRDAKNGLSAPPRLTLTNLADIATKPAWAIGMLRTSQRTFGNIVGHVKGLDDLRSLSTWMVSQGDASITWRDVEWVKRLWGGKLIIKGIMDAQDAHCALAAGADAVVVSNHGGRQLDGAPSTISVLPEIVEAVAGRAAVWVDGGIRSGQDVIKVLACGASAALIGRAFLYGLGALGEKGVTRALEIIFNDLSLTMALCGVRNLSAVDGRILHPR